MVLLEPPGNNQHENVCTEGFQAFNVCLLLGRAVTTAGMLTYLMMVFIAAIRLAINLVVLVGKLVSLILTGTSASIITTPIRMEEQTNNKDIVLREKLAIQRTVMANQRTFLSFLRTSLYFSVAGISISELIEIRHGEVIVAILWMIGIGLFITGVITYVNQRNKIAVSKRQIDNS